MGIIYDSLEIAEMRKTIEELKEENERIRQNNVSHETYKMLLDENEKLKKEQQEREKGCEICNGELPCDNGCDGFCDICNVPEVYKTIHKTGQYNYCPMCGRKLGGEENA